MNFAGTVKINKCAVFLLIAGVFFIIYVFTSSTNSSISIGSSNNKVDLRKLVIGLILAAKTGGDQVIKISKEADFGGIHTKGKTKEGDLEKKKNYLISAKKKK